MRRTGIVATAIALPAAGAWWLRQASVRTPISLQARSQVGLGAQPALHDPAMQLRPVLREALGYSGQKIPWDRRCDLIRSLPDDLGGDEIKALLAALVERRKPAVTAAIHSTYVHEIACRLQRCSEARPAFAKALSSIAMDHGSDSTTRDYAIQHLRQVWNAAEEQTSLRDEVVATFGQLLAREPVVAAPALLSLHLLGTENFGRDPVPNSVAAPRAVSDAAIQRQLAPIFAETTDAGNLALRLTAARIAGERRMESYRQPLLDLVFDSSEHAMVRMAAANAIGRIANPDDLRKLGSFPPGDERVTTAVKHALRNRSSL